MTKSEKLKEIIDILVVQCSKNIAEKRYVQYPLCVLFSYDVNRDMIISAPVVSKEDETLEEIIERAKKLVIGIDSLTNIFAGIMLLKNEELISGEVDILGEGCIRKLDCYKQQIIEKDVPTEFTSFLL